MTSDPHFIGRLALEVGARDLDMAHLLRPRIEAIARGLLPRLLAEAFDAFVPSDQYLQLTRLDVDLGLLRADHLEDDLSVALARELSQALARALLEAVQAPSDAARLHGPRAHALQQFERYLSTGLLPFQRQAQPFDAREHLHLLAAEQPEALVAMLQRHGRDHRVLERLVLQLGEAGLAALLKVLAPADAVTIAGLLVDVLVAHRHLKWPEAVAEPVLRQRLWITTLEFLLNDAGTSFNRRRYLAFLLRREAVRLGVDYRALLRLLAAAVRRAWERAPLRTALPGTLVALLQEQQGSEIEQAAEGGSTSDLHQRIARYLHTGLPQDAGGDLPARAARHPQLLEAAARGLAQAHPANVPALAERLLGLWLPHELLEALALARSPAWAQRAQALLETPGAASADGDLALWRPVVMALLRGEAPPPLPASPPPGEQLDRFAALARWLDGAGAASPPADAQQGLLQLNLAQLAELFVRADVEQTAVRIGLALQALGDGVARERLLTRLAPWAASSTGPLARTLAQLDETSQVALLAQAAAATLAGTPIEWDALIACGAAKGAGPHPALSGPISLASGEEREAKPPAAGLAPGVAPAPKAGVSAADRAGVFAWLEGRSVGTAEAARLSRWLANMADAGDADLMRYLAHARTRPKARARWAQVLPPEVLGRVVHRLVPACAHTLLHGMSLLRAAWRQTARFGSRRTEPEQLWTHLFDLIAAPESVNVPAVLSALAQGLAGSDTESLKALRARTLQLAEAGGHASVTAALRRVSSAPAGASPTPAPWPRTPADTPPPARVPRQGAKATQPTGHDALPHPTEPEGPLYVGNAGLVLLGPFLPALFERLQLLSSDDSGVARIAGAEAASRGVHLLQYLADARLDRPEPELALNKLLCGLSTAQPIARSIEPEARDLELCDELLRAVLGHWPALKNTSIEGLRQTFLQREGRLLRSRGQWILHVQRKTLDVLTDQVPWSFSVIYHRWMADPIHVTW